MSYEYHGYDYVATEQVKNMGYTKEVYVWKDSYIRDNTTYEDCIDAMHRWNEGLRNRDNIYISAAIISLNLLLREEIGNKFLNNEDITVYGKYAFIPSLDKMVEIPPLIGLETVLELYRL